MDWSYAFTLHGFVSDSFFFLVPLIRNENEIGMKNTIPINRVSETLLLVFFVVISTMRCQTISLVLCSVILR